MRASGEATKVREGKALRDGDGRGKPGERAGAGRSGAGGTASGRDRGWARGRDVAGGKGATAGGGGREAADGVGSEPGHARVVRRGAAGGKPAAPGVASGSAGSASGAAPQESSHSAGTPALRLRPELLALGLLLATLPLYAPNARLYMRLGADPGPLGSFNLAMAVSLGLAGLVCATVSLRRPGWHGFSRPVLLISSLAYVVVFAGLMACLCWGAPAGWLPWAMGAVEGVCALAVALGWIACLPGELRGALLHVGLACGLAATVTWAFGFLPGQTTAVAAVAACAVGALVPVAALPRVAAVSAPEPGGAGVGPARRQGGPAVRAGAPQAGSLAASACALQVAASSAAPRAKGEAAYLDAPVAQAVPAFSPCGQAAGALRLARNLLSILWMPFLGFLAFVFITASYRFPEGVMALDTETTGALLALAVTLAVCLPRLRTPLALVVDKLALPACVAVSIVLGAFPADTPLFLLGAASVFAPLIFMGIYAGASLAVVSKAGEFPLAFTVGLLLAITSLVSTLGVAFFNCTQVDLGPWAWVLICAYFGLFVADLGVSSWRRIACPAAEGEAGTSAATVPDGDALEVRARALARAYGLSAREAEVLGYLAHGYSSTYIAKALFISANTVRSHTYNLYRKLGVDSRAALLELVNG